MNEKLKKILKKIGKIIAIIISWLVGSIVALYLLGWLLIFLWYLAFDYPKISFKEFLEIDACIDCGGCWDYNHHRCETKDYGFCYNDEADCNRNNGIWNEDLKYCKFVKESM